MSTMDFRVAILGAGPIGCATAAYLQAQGVSAAIWSPTGRRLTRAAPDTASFVVTGARQGTVDVQWLQTLADIAGFTHVFVCLPGTLYQPVLQAAAPHWQDGQTVVVSGALSLCPLWLQQQAAGRGVGLQTAGWGTTLTTAHFLADGRLHVNALRGRIDMSTLAADGSAPTAQQACEALFGPRFVRSDNLLASTLANINPIAHAAEVIPNLSRMDEGEAWPLFGRFGRVVARIADGLDRERIALATALGFDLPTLAEHYQRSYHVPHGPLETMAAAIEAAGAGPLGPNHLDHRYVLEDAPFGLAFQERLAQLAGVPCPALSASITLLETIYQQSFRDQNPLLGDLFDSPDALAALLSRCNTASAAA